MFLIACGAPSPPPSAPARVEPPTAPAPTGVHGRVLDHAGTPLPMAHARLLAADGTVAREQVAERDGSFALAWAPGAARERLVRVELSGVSAKPETIVIATEDAMPRAGVTVRLGTHGRAPAKGSRSIIVFGAGPDSRLQKLAEQADGTFAGSFALPDGRYGYQIVGLSAEGNPLNGTFGDGYERDDEGLYRSLFTVAGGKATITFDATKLPPPGRPVVVSFPGEARVSAGIRGITERVAAARERYLATVTEALRAGKPRSILTSKEHWLDLRRALADIERTAREQTVRDAAAVAYFAEGEFDATEEERARARGILERVSPADPLWTLWKAGWGAPAMALPNVLATAGDARAAAYGDEVIARHPDTTTVGDFVFAQLSREKDTARARELFAMLQRPRFKGTEAQTHAAVHDPDAVTAAGKDVAPFAFRPLPGSGRSSSKGIEATPPITPATLAGKVYLVDVWSTWCGPCVTELPQLQALYAKHAGKDRRFEIVSVSVDEDPATVRKFQTDPAHSMPWRHAFAGDDPKAVKLLTGFERPPLPFHILVDGKGKIVAASPHLRAEALGSVVDELLR